MTNRRSFIAALGAGLLGLRAASGVKGRFELGIGTYTYRGVSVDQMIDDLRALKIRQIELSSPDYFLPALKLEAVQSLRAKLDQAGIAAISYFCGDIKTETDLDLTVQVARGLGAHHVSGSAVGDALRMIDTRLTREGMKFGIHNHWFRGRRFEYESPEDILKALSSLSNTMGATLDTGHMASCGHDPVEALAKLRSRLQVVHLKDVARAGNDENVILGAGIAKIEDVIRELKRQEFAGLAAIEFEAEPQNPQPAVTRCVEFARKRI